jgi:hypothetical protein
MLNAGSTRRGIGIAIAPYGAKRPKRTRRFDP